jgi:tRNA U34 5-methylaminomethyl-2-thiouridine-forming methyltransferase MnmC
MDQQGDVIWAECGTPESLRFGDPYFTKGAGLDETRHVFLAGNDLPARLRPGFHVAELGFGTGLNLLALAQSAPCAVRFTSFEAYPLSSDDMARALGMFDLPLAPDLIRAWAASKGPVRAFDVGPVTVEIRIADARDALPAWSGTADAWFLDGFAPSRNPELWGPDLMAEVARHTAPGGTFATYTAAGSVRAALAEAGFDVTRTAGFGRKKHMTRGVRR